MDCREVREYLPAYVEQAEGPRAQSVENHLITCLECATELAQYHEMQEALASLPAQVIEPPAWLLGTLTEAVAKRAARRETVRHAADKLADPRVIVTGGALVAAGLAGALLLRGRRRRRRTVTRRFREALAEA